MATLEISIDRKNAKQGAWVIGGILFVMVVGALWLVVTDSIEWGGPTSWLIGGVVFGWLFGGLFAMTARLFNLSTFEGVALTLTPNGVFDQWSSPNRFLAWDEISYVDWKDVGVTLVLRIVPTERSFTSRVRTLFGVPELEFPQQYLTTSPSIIAQYFLDQAPQEKVR